jgi:ATP-dependent DNA ligase
MRLPITPPISAMEAKIQSDLPRGPGWQYEPKWDGFRALAFRDGDEVLVFSRNQRPLTRYFPELVPALRGIAPQRIVLDAEIVIFTGKGTDFDAMLMRIHPASSRIQMLAAQYDGTGLDGIVAKRLDDVYHPGERAMVKVKQQRTADCVVGGFRWGKDGKRVGSLLLGVYDGRHLEYIGHTSSFDDETRHDLVKLLEPHRGASDFGEGRTPGGPSRWATERSMEWEPLRPELVCEVAFDRLESGRFRHGVRFVRWRPDKSPHECTYAALKREASVELTNLFKPG